jgi:hypothetical protein
MITLCFGLRFSEPKIFLETKARCTDPKRLMGIGIIIMVAQHTLLSDGWWILTLMRSINKF